MWAWYRNKFSHKWSDTTGVVSNSNQRIEVGYSGEYTSSAGPPKEQMLLIWMEK